MTLIANDLAHPADSWGRASDVPLHGRDDPYDRATPNAPDRDGSGTSDAVTAGGDRTGWCTDGSHSTDAPPEPDWAAQASEQVVRERLALAAQAPAGLDAAGVIEALTAGLAGPAGLAGAGLVDGIRAVQRLINHYQAVQQQWIAALARPGVAVGLPQLVDACQHPAGRVTGAFRPPDELPDDLPVGSDGEPDLTPLLEHPAWVAPLADTAARIASAEVGCALRMAPITARIRVEKALAAIDSLPATHAAQHAGDLDAYRVAIITEGTSVLTDAQRHAVEREVLAGAVSRTPGVLRDQVDRAVIAADPEAAAERVRRAKVGRGVRVDKDADDMAVFRALLHCADAQLAYGVLDEQAVALTAAGLAAGRGSAQLRADVFCDLFRTLATTGHAHLTGRPCGSGAPGTPPDDAATGAAGGVADGSGARFSGVEPCPGTCGEQPAGGHRQGGRAAAVAGRRRRTALNVYLDGSTLAGLDDRPGELAGYGIITAETGRALAASADTIRALIIRPIVTGVENVTDTTHVAVARAEAGLPNGAAAAIAVASGRTPAAVDHGIGTVPEAPPLSGSPPGRGHSDNPVRSRVCGTALDAGRAVYRPPDAIADYVMARDRTCSWPGCRASGRRCDGDHRHAYRDGGATCACNIDLLCRFHHQVKTFASWHAVPGPDGRLLWISPTGHRYPAEQGHALLEAGGPLGTADRFPSAGGPPGTADRFPPAGGPPGTADRLPSADGLPGTPDCLPPAGGDDPPPF